MSNRKKSEKNRQFNSLAAIISPENFSFLLDFLPNEEKLPGSCSSIVIPWFTVWKRSRSWPDWTCVSLTMLSSSRWHWWYASTFPPGKPDKRTLQSCTKCAALSLCPVGKYMKKMKTSAGLRQDMRFLNWLCSYNVLQFGYTMTGDRCIWLNLLML